MASAADSGALLVQIDGVDVTGIQTVPNTGSPDSFVTLTLGSATLSEGPHLLRVVILGGSFELEWIELN